MFRRFDRMPACDRQTDRQTDPHSDGHLATAYPRRASDVVKAKILSPKPQPSRKGRGQGQS